MSSSLPTKDPFTVVDPETIFASATGAVPAAAWDALAAGRVYASASWLDYCRGRYPLTGGVHTGNPQAPRAAAAVTAVGEASRHYRWSEQLRTRGLPALPPSGLLFGQQRGYQSHLLHEAAVRPADAASEILTVMRSVAAGPLINRLFEYEEDTPSACVAMYLDTADLLAFRAAGVTSPALLLELDAWIPVPSDGWDGYLASLGSKRRVDAVRRDRRRFEAVGYHVEHLHLTDCVENVAPLLASTVHKYGRETDAESLSRMLTIKAESMGTRAEVLLCRDPHGNAVGFCLFFDWMETLYLRSVGFDYARLVDAAEYFNLTYYLTMQVAIQRGRRWLHAGVDAIEAKALRGAELRGLWQLDLSARSSLDASRDAVRAANAAYLERSRASSKAVAAALAEDVRTIPV